MGYASGIFGIFDRQKQKVSVATDYDAVDEGDKIHRTRMKVEQLLEKWGKQCWRSMMITHCDFLCPSACSYLVLIEDSGELLSMVSLRAIRWVKAHVKENNKQKVSTKVQSEEFNCLNALTTAVKN